MRKLTQLLLMALAGLPVSLFAQTIYVKEGGTGTGTSWVNATGDLQIALEKALSGTSIWVAAGTYYPVSCQSCSERERSISFEIPDGVRLLGGFTGDETRESQRDWKRNVTTLSGNIGRKDCLDNSYTVVYTRNVSAKTEVNGFVIADGNANADAVPGHPSRAGGGWFNDGRGIGNASNPTIFGCLFLNNQAKEGAAMFNNGDHGQSNPELIECVFSGNYAIYGGGGLFNHGQSGQSRPRLLSCQFVNNHAAFGAAIFSACEADLEPLIEHTTFVNNKAVRGGGLFYLGIDYKPWLRTCRFLNNSSKEGEDVFVLQGKVIPEKLLAMVNLD